MDWSPWFVAAALVVAAVGVGFAMPAMLRDTRRRQAAGAGGSLAGIAGGMDAVWRPSAEEAHADWESAVEMPAPAPLAGDKGLDDGRITIDVPAEH
jgi:hypothetical protein